MCDISKADILGVIFCGGKASRLGGISKMQVELGGKSLLEHAAAHLRGAVDGIALSVKADTPLPENHGFEIIHDLHDKSVAIALVSALRFAKDKGYKAILTLPVDTPFLPTDYASQMIAASHDAQRVCAKHNGQIHGLHSLWTTQGYNILEGQVIHKKYYKIMNLYELPLSTYCSFTNVDNPHFLNINTPENLKIAQCIAAAQS